MNLAYPFGFDHRGRTAEADDERHVRDLIEQVLFTAPGERVMNPGFGSGIAQMVFAPNATELAGATQMLLQAALQRWLGELITVHMVSVSAVEAVLSVTVQYALRGSDTLKVQTFQQPTGGAA